MIKLKEWKLIGYEGNDKQKYRMANGYVLGHPKITDGCYIYTSPIEEIRVDADNNRLLVWTHSQNEYELLLADMGFDDYKDTRAYLTEKLHISALVIAKYRGLHETNEKQRFLKASEILEENELYLEFVGLQATQAYYMNSTGEIKKIRTMKSPVIVTVQMDGEFDFTYLKPHYSPSVSNGYGITPECCDSGTLKAIRIFNSGCRELPFFGKKSTIICKVGEVTTIEKEEWTDSIEMLQDSERIKEEVEKLL